MIGSILLMILYAAIVAAINYLRGWKILPAFVLAFLTAYFLTLPVSLLIICVFMYIRGVNEFNLRGQTLVATRRKRKGTLDNYEPPVDVGLRKDLIQ